MKMNKTRLLEKISIQSGISADECSAVLKTFERILSEELTRKIHRYGGWILLLVALLVSAVAFSQTPQRKGRPVQTIRGMVIDGDSKHPIPYATVRLSEKEGTGTITDSLGRFSIPQVPVGRHTVEAAFMGYEPGIFREILVTSAKEVYLEIPLKESVNELNEVVIRARTNKEEAMNKMATTGARMLSVEEASRYAGGFDDPARLVSSFAGVAPSVSSNGISIHGNAPICCSGDWKTLKFPTRITLRILLHWVEEYFHLLVRRYWVIPISLPELFRQNMEMRYPVCLI